MSSWSLTVGGDDLTPYVLPSIRLRETASSSQDTSTFTVNGTHSSIVVGAPVLLTDANGNTAWEGIVTGINPFDNATGVMAATLASQCAVGYTYGSASGNDVAVLAQGLLAATPVPWGGPANFGLEVGGLSFTRVDEGLSVLATLAGSTWRVQNGKCVFVNATNGIATIPVAMQTTNNAAASVSVLGGADYQTRIPLSITVPTVGGPLGPTLHASFPEIADAGTLGVLAANLAEMYGSGAITATASITGTVRAGDWVQDQNGVVAIAWQTLYEIVAGKLQVTLQIGFPALPTTPQYSPAFTDTMHRFPVSRLTSDYVVQGCSASISGATISMGSGIIVIADALSSISGSSLTPSNGVSYITATSSGYALASQPLQPGAGVNLYRVSVAGGVIVGLTDIRQHGGSGSNNVQPNALYPVHFSGDTSADRSVAIFNAATKTVNHVIMSLPTQDVVLNNGGSGQLNVAPAGSVTGNLTGGNIQGGTIQTAHISNQAVAGQQIIPTVYSTNQTNTQGAGISATDWYSVLAGAYVTSGNTISNGDNLRWNTGSSSYGGSTDPYMELLTLAGSSSATFVFQHSAFLSGAGGRPRVFFQGQSSGSTSNQQQSTPFSGSSTCTVSATATWKSGIGYYNFHYSQSNGAAYTVSLTTNTAVGTGTPLGLSLNSVNCPSANDGSSSLTVQLTDSHSNVLQTWTGITTAQNLSYSTAHAADSFTWSVWAVPSNNDGTSNPYNENMQDTFSGTATYYNSVGSTGQTYVKAADGTQRLTASDSNILFTMVTADTIAFQVFNSSTSATTFSIGMDVSGL